MIQLDYKKILVICSFVLNVILLWLMCDSSDRENALRDELLRSQGRIEVLQQRDVIFAQMADSLIKIGDSLSVELAKKPKERLVIKKIKDEEIRRIIALSIDSNVRIFAKRVSTVDVNR